jgi:hypothetical protein
MSVSSLASLTKLRVLSCHDCESLFFSNGIWRVRVFSSSSTCIKRGKSRACLSNVVAFHTTQSHIQKFYDYRLHGSFSARWMNHPSINYPKVLWTPSSCLFWPVSAFQKQYSKHRGRGSLAAGVYKFSYLTVYSSSLVFFTSTQNLWTAFKCLFWLNLRKQ